MKHGLFLGFVLLAIGAKGASDGPRGDLERMSGTWDSHLLEAGGQAIPAKERELFKMRLVIRGNSYGFFMDDKQIMSGTISLDSSKKPRTIDAVPGGGPHKGKVQPGIYQFQGDDLVFIFTEPGQRRPTEFRTRAGTQEMLILCKRRGD